MKCGFYGVFSGRAKGGCKRKRKGLIIFILNHGHLGTQTRQKKTFACGNGGDEKSLHPGGSKFIL